MKISATITLAMSVASAAAFAPVSRDHTTSSQSALSATRRNFLEIAGAAAIFTGPSAAFAEGRAMYLTEPTEEFKQNEAKAAEFKRQQLLIKKEFVAVLDKLVGESNDADALVKDLKDLKALIAKTGGLPLGIKKEELYKTIRSKKAKGFWPTPVEVAYQSLIQEIAFQQSPNLEKDMGNFYQ